MDGARCNRDPGRRTDWTPPPRARRGGDDQLVMAGRGRSVSGGVDEFWAGLPAKVEHRVRVPMLEALLWIGLPLSPREFVNVLDGDISMWDAAYHLQVLETLGVVAPVSAPPEDEPTQTDDFDEPYRLGEDDDNDDTEQDDRDR